MIYKTSTDLLNDFCLAMWANNIKYVGDVYEFLLEISLLSFVVNVVQNFTFKCAESIITDNFKVDIHSIYNNMMVCTAMQIVNWSIVSQFHSVQ